MARTTPIFTAFTQGEWTPRLDGRVDLKTYFQACRDLKNMTVWPHGGATKRPGTYYIAPVKTSAKTTRLIPFEYSTEQAYILEFGHEYIRFYMNGGQIQSMGSAYEIATPYQDTDLFDIKFVQSADTMYLVHPDHAPRKLTRSAHTTWTLNVVDFVWGPFLTENDGATTLTPAAVTGTGVDLTASTSDFFEADHVGALFKLTGDINVTDSFSSVTDSSSYQDLDTGESLVCSLSGTWVGTMTLQRSYDGGSTWVDYAAYTTNTTFEVIALQDAMQYRWSMTAWTSGTCNARLTKASQSGYVVVTSITSGTVAVVTVVETLPNTDATLQWCEGAWSDVQGWPSSIAFFEQRLCAAGTESRPQTVWASQVDDYENFETGADDSDALSFTLASEQVNAARWLESGDVLHMGTHGGTWRLGATNTDDPVTPTDVKVRQNNKQFGASSVQAFQVGDVVLYLQKGGWKLRTLSYKFETDSYISRDISQKAEHLMQTGIVDMAFAAQPDPTVWMVRGDGHLIGVTYDQENGVLAFHDHDTGASGEFESVAVIPGTDRDEVWVIVKRTINSATVRCVEQFMTPLWSDQEDAFYLDCGYTYDSVATDTITGLDHLEGEEVAVLADGAVHPSRTVESGAITLKAEYEKVHVGLAYTARLKTMRMEAGAQAGTAQGKLKKAHKIRVRLYQTLGLKAGPDVDHLDEVPFRGGSDPMDAPPPLFSGDKEITFRGGFNRDGYITLVNDQPLPFSVVAIIPTITTSDL